jgi:hypothetical protein
VTSLYDRPMLKNAIITEDRDGRARLEQQIGASGKHKIRGRIAGPDHVSLKQSRIATNGRSINLNLPAGHDKTDARRRRSHAHQAAAGEQRNSGL